jgi:dihydroorotate dehydrogenase electron transfer subunit
MVRLDLHVPGWLAATPGQFALLHHERSVCFLPRAFSVHAQRSETVSFLIAPVGPGTAELAACAVGDAVWVIGPVGRGFDEVLDWWHGGAAASRRLVVVAGGVGAAPFPALLDALGPRDETAIVPASRGGDSDAPPEGRGEVVVVLGFRDALQAEATHTFEAPADSLRAKGVAVRIETVTEDGRLGRAGLVTELLAEELQAGDLVVVCGAQAMCGAVWQVCGSINSVRTWFSLEAGMACGVGSCQGCVLPLADGTLAKVCRRGPVFAGAEVLASTCGSCAPAGGPR